MLAADQNEARWLFSKEDDNDEVTRYQKKLMNILKNFDSMSLMEK